MHLHSRLYLPPSVLLGREDSHPFVRTKFAASPPAAMWWSRAEDLDLTEKDWTQCTCETALPTECPTVILD